MDFKEFFRGFLFDRTNPKSTQDEIIRNEDQMEDFRNGPRDFQGFGHNQESRFVFGDMFSMMGEMFREVESSMREMDEFFGNNFEREFFQEAHPPPQIMDKSVNDQELQSKDNIRDHILKREYTTPSLRHKSKKEDLVDTDLDDLYNNSSFDINQFLPPASNSKKIDMERHRQPDYSDSSSHSKNNSEFKFSYNFSQYTYQNGKMVQGKTVKRTPEGEEVITFTQNEDGEIKSKTEYQPSDAIVPIKPLKEPQNNFENGGDGKLPFGLFEKFFRPRI